MSTKEAIHAMALILAPIVLGTARDAFSETNEPAAEPILVELTIGRVLHVNTNYNFIILRCGSLPSPAGEAKVHRGSAVVGRVIISSFDRLPFVSADVIDGHPQIGDLVKQVVKRCENAPSDGRKE